MLVIIAEQQLTGHMKVDARNKKVNMKYVLQTMSAKTHYTAGSQHQVTDKTTSQNAFHYIHRLMDNNLDGIKLVAPILQKLLSMITK